MGRMSHQLALRSKAKGAKSAKKGDGLGLSSWSYYQEFDDTITISLGVRYARSRGCTRQHQHTLMSLSRPDALHALPLTTILSPCYVVRYWLATTTLLEKLFPERAQRVHEQAARGERESISLRRSMREPSICSDTVRACGLDGTASVCTVWDRARAR